MASLATAMWRTMHRWPDRELEELGKQLNAGLKLC
jgi:hypothetical protein